MSSDSISIDSIVPKHGPSVDIMNAQITMNMTHGTYTFTGALTARTMGIYTTLMPPHVLVECGAIAVATMGSSASALTSTTALPENVRPMLVQYLPIHPILGGTGYLGALKVATTGFMTMYLSAAEAQFPQASALSVDSFSGQWCVQQY